MFKKYFKSEYFISSIKVFLIIIISQFIHSFISYEIINKNKFNQNIVAENIQILHANIIDDNFFHESDTSSSNASNKKESDDVFYYILGIMILIASGFILKQRYEQYIKQRDNLFH